MKNWAAGLAVLMGLLGVMGGAVAYAGSIESDPIDLIEQAQPQLVAASAKAERTIGVCQLIQGADRPPSAFNAMSPTTAAWIYLRRVENLAKEVTDQTLVNAKTTLLKGATHGALKYIGTEQGEAYYQYFPDSGYAGADQATFLVEMGNYKVKLIYHFKVGGEFGATDGYNSYDDKKNCPNGSYWKISATQDADGSLIVNSVDYLPSAPSTSDTLTSSTLKGASLELISAAKISK